MAWFARIAAGLLLALGLTLSAWAQTATPDYATWESTAIRAEEAIEAGRASDSALEELRVEIVVWRDAFTAAQSSNTLRIKTLQDQIAALGEVPEGREEAPDIAERRSALNKQLADLRAPVIRAEEAYLRADGLIGEIDSLIRTRQADRLLALGPTPLNPQYWPAALDALYQSANSMWLELYQAAKTPAKLAVMRSNLPVVMLLLTIALVLGVKGNTWVRRALTGLKGTSVRGGPVWSFLLSLGRIVLPAVAIYLAVFAVKSTGMLGLRTGEMVDLLPVWALAFLVVRWLAEEVLYREDGAALIHLEPVRRVEAVFYAHMMALVTVLRMALYVLATISVFDETVLAVLDFPLLVVLGLMLFRLGLILQSGRPSGDTTEESDSQRFRSQLLHIFGKGLIVVGLLGPILAGIGYGGVGRGMILPMVQTVGVLAVLLVLQRFIGDLYAMIVGDEADARNSLIPVMTGFILILMTLPVLALVWGARVADLTELWTRFHEGFALGETRISPTDFLLVLVLFIVGFLVTRLLQGGLRRTVLPKTRIDAGGRNAIVSGVGYVGIFISAIVAITTAGLDLSSLAIVAGALSVGIGFGLQNIVSNFVSGIILLIERPISEGDWIEVGGQHGHVKTISVRSTRIETFDRTDVIVPNADLVSGTVTNYTRGNSIGRVKVAVGVAYGTDTMRVEKILKNIARDHPMVMMNPEPNVYLMGFGADSVDFEIRAILSDVHQVMQVKSDMNHEIARRFAEEGIEIPFAQRDIWLRNPEALHPKAPVDRGAEIEDTPPTTGVPE
ncbi:DUF3772 domain-containing protein [Pseudoprimorskyibacter insulae]|uniref:Putative MscS family protein.1 n=1 Tax=Pseudoprimorskyibacter insulae TaxID=1695997 RepID=A0A2R8AW92_9RHOB|nr:DUF3772 domain-containing protein [Pseudoprimorskyibacter insulae]SPF80293.1 putative MscS family protein.1 [Pseudoprimorskyibacter insulae]